MRHMSNNPDNPAVTIRPFDTDGSDERQYCSPGFDLPVGQFARTVYGEYAEYHTSADDKSFMSINAVRMSVESVAACLAILERAGCFKSAVQHGEPMMSKRQLYPTVNAPSSTHRSTEHASPPIDPQIQDIMRLVNFADGSRPLINAAVEYDIPPGQYVATVDLLVENELLRPI